MKFNISIAFIFLLVSPAATAQQTSTTKQSPFKPPVVKTTLGIRSGNDTVHIEEATQLVKLPLVIKDQKGNSYQLENYRLLYKKRGYIENSETGKPELHYTISASRFDGTPLPKVWSENIRSNLKPGEELYFFEILVADKDGKKFYAPDIRIVVK